jgi:aminoglycoside phosphotransferase (APT) family kinase protein
MLDIEDHAALRGWLRSHGHLAEGPAPCTTLRGGVSNKAILIERPVGPGLVVKQALAKLRVEAEWFSDPSRVHREALGLRVLNTLLPSGVTPEFVFEDHADHLLGMTAVPAPHENWKSLLMLGRVDADHVDQFAQTLAMIHGGAASRSSELSESFRDRGFFESLRLEPYFLYSAAQVPTAADFLRRVVHELRHHRLTLVHGDYSPKNILLHDGRLVLLDHEVIHWGDPAFDLGFALTHLLSKARHLRGRRAALLEASIRFHRHYRSQLADVSWRDGFEARAARYTLACLLARVRGRSPLEYLNDDDRRDQEAAVLTLLDARPDSIDQLIERWAGLLETGR